jgi:hypothetical protein
LGSIGRKRDKNQPIQHHKVQFESLSDEAVRQEFLERASQVFEHPQAKDQSEQRIVELERMVGQRAMQLEMAKKY